MFLFKYITLKTTDIKESHKMKYYSKDQHMLNKSEN